MSTELCSLTYNIKSVVGLRKYMATENGARSTSLESHYLSNEVELTASVLWFIAVSLAMISTGQR